MFANKMIPAVCGAVHFKMSDKEAFRIRGLFLLHARVFGRYALMTPCEMCRSAARLPYAATPYQLAVVTRTEKRLWERLHVLAALPRH